MKLRPYQEKSSDIAVDYFLGPSEKPSIVVAPTAFGICVLMQYLWIMKNQFDPNYNSIKKNAVELLKTGISLTKASKQLNLSREALTKWGKEAGIKYTQSDKRPINSRVFDVIDTEEKAYWLGFLFADGYIADSGNVEISLKLSDINHLYKFQSFIGLNNAVKQDSYRCRIYFMDKNIAENLKKYGMTPRKSLTLKYPSSQVVPQHLEGHFIRGYFDGDGSVPNPEKMPIGLSVLGTEDFLSGILRYINVDKPIVVKYSNNKSGVRFFYLHGKKAFLFFQKVYVGSTIYLDRKKDRVESMIHKYNNRKRKSLK